MNPTTVLVAYLGAREEQLGQHAVAEMLGGMATAVLGVEWVTFSVTEAVKEVVAAEFSLPLHRYDTPEQKTQPLALYREWTYRRLVEHVAQHLPREFCLHHLQSRLRAERESPLLTLFSRNVPASLGLPAPVPRRKLLQVTDVATADEYDLLRTLGAQFVAVQRRLDLPRLCRRRRGWWPIMLCTTTARWTTCGWR